MSNNILLKSTSKRTFVKGLSALLGASTVAHLTAGNALASAMSFQQKTGVQARKLFTKQQFNVLSAVCSTIIPETDTPSAAQLNVHGFVDHQLVTCHQKTEQVNALAIIDVINAKAKQLHTADFYQLTAIQKVQILESIESGAMSFTEKHQQQFSDLKALIVFGYFTTEVGATEVLAYQAVPGGFKGSVPYDSVGKTYGSLAYY
ncbi:gluconate 2-dehydrogenase subunit 3 family protein [Thalassotalea hakodatensis]|uniref:gluconate 2-dehydrogenase subunit 3 family protein n=1 Tax=Thalassotalea hakodatensis TaxID=3030492 RepID=UPI0025734179|nr:gluconate 2-dehydrogenase subunit 3 family protein [Thalassotalea hakodatensis]